MTKQSIAEVAALVLTVIRDRKAIYERKADQADALADDTMNRHDIMTHTVEALDHLLFDVAKSIDDHLISQGADHDR